MLAAIAGTVSVIFELCYITMSSIVSLIHWVVTEPLPDIIEFIADFFSQVSTTAILCFQLVLESIQRLIELTFTAILSTFSFLEGAWDVVTKAIPLVWGYIISAIFTVYSLGFTACSVSISCCLTVYNTACDGVTLVLPYVVFLANAVMYIFWTIVTSVVQGTLTIISVVWSVINFIISSVISIGADITHILWNIRGLFLPGDTLHVEEQPASTISQLLHTLNAFLSGDKLHVEDKPTSTMSQLLHTLSVYALKVLVIAVTVIILLVLLYGLYYSLPVLKNYWLGLQQYWHNPPPRNMRQNPVDNAAQLVHVADRPRQRHRALSQPNVPAQLPNTQPSPPPTPTNPPPSTGRSPSTDDADQNRLCVVCIDNERQVLLRPCKHYCVCEVCSRRLGGVCPICRANFTTSEVVHIFYD